MSGIREKNDKFSRLIRCSHIWGLKIGLGWLLIIFDNFLKKIQNFLKPGAPWVAIFTQKRLKIAQNTLRYAIFQVKIHCFLKIEAYNSPKWYQESKNWLLGTFDNFWHFFEKNLILLRPEAPWVANFTQKRLRIAQNTVKDAIFHVKIHCFSKIEAYNGPKWYQGFKNWLLGTFDDFCMFCFSVSNYSQASCKRFMGHKKLYVPRVKRSFGILNAWRNLE